MCMQETTRGQGGSVGASGSASRAGKGDKGGKAAASPKKQRGAEEETPGKSKKAKAATPKVDAALAEAKVLKAVLQTTSASSSTMIKQVENDNDHWGWANNIENVGKLRGLQADINAQLGQFGQAFLLLEVKEVKQQWGEEHLLFELQQFNLLRGKVEEFSRKVKGLMSMHKAHKASL